MTVADPRTYAALLRRGSVGLGQSYVEGWWDSDDLTALVRILIRNIEEPGRVADRGAQVVRLLAGFKHRSAPRDKGIDRQHVQAHYDLGNDFFELMLDPTMMYSCGVFEHPDATLQQASTAKLDRICQRLDLGPQDHVLEIGTGWGGFAVHAAAHYGCRVTTTTISDAQYHYAAKRVARMGLGRLVTVLNDDYRDLTGTYDKVVSIEMIEAIGWKQFDTFFATCSRLLRDTGLMALQAIVIADQSYERAKRNDDFIKQMIFPGGCLPSIEAITRSCTRATDLRRRPSRRHRRSLRRDVAPVAGKLHRPHRRRLRHRPRPVVPAAMAAVPVLLRSGVRRASRQRRADDPGQAPLEAVRSPLSARSRPGSVRRSALEDSFHRSHRLTGVEPDQPTAPRARAASSPATAAPPTRTGTLARNDTHRADHLDDRLISGNRRTDQHGDQAHRHPSGARERLHRRVRPQVHHVKPGRPELVGHHRTRERMQIAGGRPQHHRPPPPPPAGEHRPQPTDDTLRYPRRPVLVGDASSPSAQRSPIDRNAGANRSTWMPAGSAPEAKASSTSAQTPGSSPATRRSAT